MDVGVLIFVSGETGGEKVDGMSACAEAFDQGINADAHAIENGERTI